MIPNKFFESASALGGSPVFAQGAGGNLSWKDGETMYVKASGFLLKNVAPKAGYVACKHAPLADYLATLEYQPRSHEQENNFNQLIESHLMPEESFGVPSIETGMHALLSRAAIHTHSVYANAIGCMDGGAGILAQLFPNSIAIPYANPGLALAKTLFIEKQKNGALPPIIFLLNHGMLTHADTMDEAFQLTLGANKTLGEYLATKKIAPFQINNQPYDFSRHLFPDSVVYSSINFDTFSPEKKNIYSEISSASNYILQSIKTLGGKANFFDPRDVEYIANMDREKHRMKMAREA